MVLPPVTRHAVPAKEDTVLDRETLEAAMRRAIELALLGPDKDQNPQVGCVILAPNGHTVAEGWHRGAGTPHAETDALSKLPATWLNRTGELTAVVTLEPCNHTGRTGPCAVALAEAGIGAVVFSAADPSPAASGGAETLRAAGVLVIGGVLEDEGQELLAPWLARQAPRAHAFTESPRSEPGKAWDLGEGVGSRESRTRAPGKSGARPRVTVKWAQTLDGRAAAADGTSQWITGEVARADVHRRRAEVDAILVGTGTLLADDPALTARGSDGDLLVPEEAQPIPVILGTRAIPEGARVNAHPALAPHGLDEPLRFDGDDLPAHLADLHARGIRQLFVEGGPTIASAFVAAGLVDEVLVYLAPALLGGKHLAIGDLGISSMDGIVRLDIDDIERLGEDLLIRASAIQLSAPQHFTRQQRGDA